MVNCYTGRHEQCCKDGACLRIRLRILHRVSSHCHESCSRAGPAVSLATSCSPILPRPSKAKLSLLMPLTIGIQVSGPRMVNIQARWALTSIACRTTWPHTLRVPSELHNRLCNDLGWPCLCIEAKTSAIALFEKRRNDNQAFTHTRLSTEQPYASGGWLAAANQLAAVHTKPCAIMVA